MAKKTGLSVKFWGVRGSIPTPGPGTRKYGGNTACIEVVGGSEPILLDAGTGLREYGMDIIRRKVPPPQRFHILLSHTHWDHIQGFPFFPQINSPGCEIHVYGPRALEKSLRDALMFQLQYSYFPLRGDELQARLVFRELDEESFKIGNVEITTKSMNHPIRVLAYRFRKGRKSGIYTGDNEPYYDFMEERATHEETGIHRRSEFIQECNQRVADFVRNCNLLIADSQYTDEEYESKRGWGHSSVGAVLDLAVRSRVKTLALFHHEPEHDDRIMDAIHRKAVARAKKMGPKLKVLTAREGMTVTL